MDKNFELSGYQKNIMNYIKNENGNLLVDAKAGSGKTSTLLLIADEIRNQNKKCIFLAFNSSIVEELKQKIVEDDSVVIKTFHSLGFSFLRSYLYKMYKQNYKIEVYEDKIKDKVKTYYGNICAEKVQMYNNELSRDDLKELHHNLIRDLVKMCNFCRYYNVNYKKEGATDWLINKCTTYLEGCYKQEMSEYQKVIISVIDEVKYEFDHPIVEDGLPTYYIDFTDMIYFPVYLNIAIPYSLKDKLDYVLVDESQDMNILQQKFINKLNTHNNRFIFVGDSYQAIYGFAGADVHSIEHIKENFTLKELPLNICYRCPKNVIKIAQSLVPDIEWNKDREDEGQVSFIQRKNLCRYISNGDIIIGRRNKDLLKIYRDFVMKDKIQVKFRNQKLVNMITSEVEVTIKEYIKAYNKGLNINKALNRKTNEYCTNNNITTLELQLEENKSSYEQEKLNWINELINQNLEDKFLSKSNQNIDYLVTCMQEYKEKGAYSFPPVKEETIQTNMRDYYEIIMSFIEDYKSLNKSILVKSFIVWLKTYLSGNLEKNLPQISSIHAMKGGEADNVFIIDYPEFPYQFSNTTQDQLQQEKNLQYVALTRAKKKLYLVEIDTDKKDEETGERLKRKNDTCVASVQKLLES